MNFLPSFRVPAVLFAAAIAASPLAQAKDHKPCANCGTVVSAHSYQRAAEHGSGMGAATGAVVGGLLGNQVGGGNGRTLATVAGAVGGGFAGNAIEKNARARTVTEVRVRMRDGSHRKFTEEGANRHYSGEPVRVVNGGLVAQR